MAVRSIATLSLSFGLVSIPVKVYSATESSAAIRFKLLSRGGARVRRQYIADEHEAPLASEDEEDARAAPESPPPTMSAQPTRGASSATPRNAKGGVPPELPIARIPQPAPARDVDADARPAGDDDGDVVPGGVLAPSHIVKGYEFEKGRFVTFSDAELKALADESRQTIDIVSFIPANAVDPVYYDKAYYLAPDRQGTKPYSLLCAAMLESGRTALAKWAWRAKEYVVQIRPVAGGLVLQQLLYADEVRSIAALDIDLADVGAAELQLALRLIEQISDDAYHAEQFVDEEKQRILAAVEQKIAGRSVVARPTRPMPSAQVIDLVAALRASLDAIAPGRTKGAPPPARAAADARERKPARRAAKAAAGDAAAPAKARGRQSSR